MTKREFLNAVITSAVSEELTTFAQSELDKLDARNSARASKVSAKKSEENAPLIEKIASVLTSEPILASEIAEKCGLSTSKVSALVKKIDGIKIEDVKVKGVGVRKAYSL